MLSSKVVNRSLFVLCLIFALILTGIIYLVRDRTAQIIDELSIDRVMAARQGFDKYISDMSDRAMLRGAIIARQERLADEIRKYEENNFELTEENYNAILNILNDFLEGFDFISVSDRNGIALARTDSGERIYPLPPNGYNLAANPDVKEVLETGKTVTSFSFMLDNTTLVITTLCPMFDGDTVIGIVTCLYDLTIPKHILAYKEQSGSEVAIFLGREEFISTLNYTDNPVRLVAGAPVIEAIFENGEDIYLNFTPIGGTTYGTVFFPLIYRDEIIGLKFIGVDVNEALQIRLDTDTLIAYIVALAVLIALSFIVIIRRYNEAIKRQVNLQTTMTNISQSFLQDEDIDKLITEAFEMLGPQMQVSQILLYKIDQDDNQKIVCSNEWIDPALHMPSYIGNSIHIPAQLFELYSNIKDKEKFYISSDNSELAEIIKPFRINFMNFLSATIFLDERLYAVVDFARKGKRTKWHRDDINAATFVTHILSSAFHKKQIEMALVSAMREAERSSEYKSAFLANVSHEIRTPMNAILGIAEIYLQDRTSRANVEEGLSMIFDSSSLLLGIINDFLDLSKIEAGKMEIVPVQYDIPSLINDTVQVCRLRYGSKPIEFALDIDKNTPLNLLGDELRIKQVLNNILSNAFKYTDTGSIVLSISAEYESEPGRWSEHSSFSDSEIEKTDFKPDVTLIIRIKDTGQGMTQEEVDLLFEEFTRFNLRVNRTTVGTGLGMSITKRLLDLMDGTISVESRPGVGSTFTVHLPQQRLDASVCGTEMSERLNSFHFRSQSVRKKAQIACEYMPYGRVLVVDDVESNLFVAKGMLIPYSLEIETADSGYEAIEYIAGGRTYDIIFMDHMMPKMDGIETVKNLRKMGYTGYIIALTANALVGQAEMFLENGFNDYIPKPIDTRDLNNMLLKYIRDKKPPEVVKAAREEAREAELLRALETENNSKSDAGDTEKTKTEKETADKAEVESFFILDAEKAIIVIEEEYDKLRSNGDFSIDLYRVTVHGMKSALRNIKEEDVSEMAQELEDAAIAQDINTINDKTPQFIAALQAILKKLGNR